jgi:hypothetical protein
MRREARQPRYMLHMRHLRERGWTPAMVRDFLGAPDELRRNPVFSSAPPMRLWTLEHVREAEALPHVAARLRAARPSDNPALAQP